MTRMTDLQLLLEHAETAATHLAGPDQALWLQNLELSLPEFRRMMEGCLARGEAAGGLRLAAALGKFWWMCGHAPEGRKTFTRLTCRGRARGSVAIGQRGSARPG